MPTFTTTTKYALRWLTGANPISDVDAGFQALAEDIDSKFAGYSAGTLASRPTSTGGTPGIAGRRYRATDTGQEFIDTGTSWVEIATAPSTLLGPWRTLAEATGMWDGTTGGGPAAGANFIRQGGFIRASPNTVGSISLGALALVPISNADLAVAGLATRMRMRLSVAGFSTPPGGTWAARLYPLTPSSADTVTLGAPLGLAASLVVPTNGVLSVASADFAPPADGTYVLGLELSAGPAAGANVQARVALEIRHA